MALTSFRQITEHNKQVKQYVKSPNDYDPDKYIAENLG
jgi:hypothetical protein